MIQTKEASDGAYQQTALHRVVSTGAFTNSVTKPLDDKCYIYITFHVSMPNVGHVMFQMVQIRIEKSDRMSFNMFIQEDQDEINRNWSELNVKMSVMCGPI